MKPAAPALLSVLLLLALASPALAQTIPTEIDVLLDLDRDPGTGCDVATPGGTFAGVEVRLITSVDDTTVTSVERQDCVNAATDTFGPLQMVDAGGWPVGFGNGDAGFNVIETYLPIDTSAFTGARLGVVATDANSNTSALLVVSPGGSLEIVLEGVTPVPVAGVVWMVGLALTLAVIALVALRRRGGVAALTLLLVVGTGGAVLVACTLDGQTSDWNSGARLAQSNASDPADGVTIRALFGEIDGGRLCFRIDMALVDDSQTTLSASTSALALSVNAPGADPALVGNPRTIIVTNTGARPAEDVQVSVSTLPAGTAIGSNTCSGTLGASASCSITITPGATSSANTMSSPCTVPPGTEPLPSTLSLTASNAPQIDVEVVVVGYGCIHRGGYLFAIDDSTPATSSIGGKVAALDETSTGWSTMLDDTAADSLTDGLANSNALSTPVGQYPAAQACLTNAGQGFTDWYLPAVCELGRFVGLGIDAGCGTTSANLYSTLHTNSLGGFTSGNYWGSSEAALSPTLAAWMQSFGTGAQSAGGKTTVQAVRCVRTITP